MAETLTKHPGIASDLVALFRNRFDVAVAEKTRKSRHAETTANAGKQAYRRQEPGRRPHFASLHQCDRSDAAHQLLPEGLSAERASDTRLQVRSPQAEGLPEPRPFREIFVYGVEVEGVHLRFGKVARGGLRWSDRAQDYRTEVLGLVKAQQVKNAVIVPVGAKGGFFPKLLPPQTNREAWLAAGTEAYKTYIRTLLSITDNIVGWRDFPACRHAAPGW